MPILLRRVARLLSRRPDTGRALAMVARAVDDRRADAAPSVAMGGV
jgi:hypothetical protein